jgi:hypothetical protein
MWAGSTPRSSASHRLLRPLPACKALMIASASASGPPPRPLILARTLRLGFHVGLCEGPGADQSTARDPGGVRSGDGITSRGAVTRYTGVNCVAFTIPEA